MHQTESFRKVQSFISDNTALADLLRLLPNETRIRLVVEDRIPGRLIVTDQGAALLEEDELKPEWEIILFSEAIRVLMQSSPESVLDWSKALAQLALAGQIGFHPRLSMQEWWNRGYPQIAVRLAPEIKNELSKLAFQSVLVANSAVEKIKSWVKRS